VETVFSVKIIGFSEATTVSGILFSTTTSLVSSLKTGFSLVEILPDVLGATLEREGVQVAADLLFTPFCETAIVKKEKSKAKLKIVFSLINFL
jgi:hypothetical protein